MYQLLRHLIMIYWWKTVLLNLKTYTFTFLPRGLYFILPFLWNTHILTTVNPVHLSKFKINATSLMKLPKVSAWPLKVKPSIHIWVALPVTLSTSPSASPVDILPPKYIFNYLKSIYSFHLHYHPGSIHDHPSLLY